MAQLVARRIPDPKVGGSNPSSFIHSFYLDFFLHVTSSELLNHVKSVAAVERWAHNPNETKHYYLSASLV